MSCCDGCATKTGCETGCAGGGCGVSCAGGACGDPQVFYAPPNTGCAPPWFGGPAAGCAAHAAVPPLFGREVAPWLVSAGTGQIVRAAPRGNIFAPVPVPAAPPVFIPRPLPPEQVMRQPLFHAIVAVPTGEPGLNIRSWAGLDAPIVSRVTNGEMVAVYQIGIPQSDGRCPQCQWWHVEQMTFLSPTPPLPATGQFDDGMEVPGRPPALLLIGFVRAIGPQGEWNLRRATPGGWPVGHVPPSTPINTGT